MIDGVIVQLMRNLFSTCCCEEFAWLVVEFDVEVEFIVQSLDCCVKSVPRQIRGIYFLKLLKSLQICLLFMKNMSTLAG